MRITDLMTPNPITVASDATASTAAKIMRDHDLGSLPVVDQDRLVGFITDRDIIVRCVANDGDCSSKPISAIMSPEIFCCRADQTPTEVMEVMAIQQVRRLPVVDANERLVGIVSIGKLAEAGSAPESVCATIKAVREPAAAS
jgi:CBS domain-containing protein